MSKIDFSIAATWGDKPIQELNRLLDVRIEQLGECARDALFATAHTVIRSIKPLVHVAKTTKKALAESYTLDDTGLVMGQERSGGKVKWMPHLPKSPVYRADIRPVCLWGGGIPAQRVHVYRVTPRFSGRRSWKKNLNKGCWYLAAYNEGVARHYAENTLMLRAIKMYAGLARASVLSMRKALAIAGNEAIPADVAAAGGSALILKTASELAHANYQRMGDSAELEAASELSYGRMALGDVNALEYAIAKAANSISGYIRSRMVDCLNKDFRTPFPEITKGGSMRQ